MRLSPRELDKLVLHQAGFLAQKRLARGLRLNHPEAVALLATQLLEFIRDGERVAQLMEKGKRLLGYDDVMPGVPSMIPEVQVEGTFPDGTKLVTVHAPICREQGNLTLALYGSGLKAMKKKSPAAHSTGSSATDSITHEPGEILLDTGTLEINAGRVAFEMEVVNLGDRPVQVGSHYPFFETNTALQFDRAKAFGCRLDIPSGTAVRFEPGEMKRVSLILFGGEGIVRGGNGLSDGLFGEAGRASALERAIEAGFATPGSKED